MASQWSIKNWDADSFLQQALSDALERHAAIYACVFLPPGPDGLELLAAGYSSGGIRVFDWRQASKLWLSSRQAARHSLHWHAHPGGVYALAVAGEGPSAALISCGDDGAVRGWSVREICEVVKEQQQQQQQQQPQQQQPQQQQRPGAGPRALFEVTVPRADPPFPITASAHPAAQALSVDQARGAAYVGASDGGVHLYDLGRLGEGGGKRGGGGAAAGGGGGGAGPAASFAGHAAAVLGMDCCGATGQVATASEVRAGAAHGGATSGSGNREVVCIAEKQLG
ncbi:hypothetical protein MNEG_13746 [Monoraphidium neglectum]|uniref:Uncharacterized protein n=1 Tax=Monoraphidium neglectum TaxID=145388 RepID=A0A0D2LXK9_9CHLO|nr:hypothetical protein MNEG_13746 [Monoraphidium neglectum]KIY94216.1 hypothetical protein MNEG_13746 [Monoraphidium neglectum]|eukprot:XP_013893236.1 hypothetical protein MNEG_13746 [Monoraphidium neglectum]